MVKRLMIMPAGSDSSDSAVDNASTSNGKSDNNNHTKVTMTVISIVADTTAVRHQTREPSGLGLRIVLRVCQ